MKNNLVVSVLVGLLAVGAVISVVFSFRLILATRELAQQQARLAMINNDSVAAQNLLNELLEYSKTHPSVDPLLIQLGAKTNQPARPANR
jgi:uncharacterized membrane protein YcjF (UPF0283 family)